MAHLAGLCRWANLPQVRYHKDSPSGAGAEQE
jgi:hypothetical protein